MQTALEYGIAGRPLSGLQSAKRARFQLPAWKYYRATKVPFVDSADLSAT